jgi:putative aminopeptidase FrvX
MLLERLSNACGVPGREEEVRALLKAELQPLVDEIWTDPIGNLIVRKGNGPVKVMLDAHMDEVGFLVGSITDDGYVKLKKIGGLDDRVLPGRAVWLTQNRIPGVMGAKAWHLISADERGKVIPLDEIYVDLGCRNRAEVEALGIEPGEPAYFATTFERLSDKVVKGKAFDDRAGCALLGELLRRAAYPGITLYGVFTCQEEVGLRGAKVAAYHLYPDVAIALEGTGSVNVVGVDPEETITNMGEGPAISVMDQSAIPNLKLLQHLTQVARDAGVIHQFRRFTKGGTDAGGISLQRAGIAACTVSVPCRYIHTNAALLNLDDFEGAIALIHHFLQSVEKGDYRP